MLTGRVLDFDGKEKTTGAQLDQKLTLQVWRIQF
jgi:hypothetical protein